MNKYAAGAMVAVIAAAGAFILIGGRADHPAIRVPAQNAQARSATPKTTAVAYAPSPRPPASPAGSGKAGPAGPAESLKQATDYLEYSKSVIDAASQGNHEAQYYLAQALHFCDIGYRIYFDHYGKRRTLDEALQWTSTQRTLRTDDARQVYDRCHRLIDEGQRADFGSPDDWIEQSSNGGFPLGQAARAKRLLDDTVTSAASGGSGANEKMAQAKKLALEALRSKDPEVIWQMGDLAPSLFKGPPDTNNARWVWRIAACQRGYDCNHDAEWVEFACRFDSNCQPYDTGVDVLRRMIGPDFDEIEQSAKDVNAKLDADQFDDLGA